MDAGLHIMIVDSGSGASEPLRSLLYTQGMVASVDIQTTLESALKELDKPDNRTNVIIIDPFSFGESAESVDWIFSIRNKHSDIVFCLFSSRENLINLSGLTGDAYERLRHYYTLAKDTPLYSWHIEISSLLLQCANYLHAVRGRRRLDSLRDKVLLLEEGESKSLILTEVERVIRDVEGGLEARKREIDLSKRSFAPFVFVDSRKFEDLVLRTLADASKSLRRNSIINGCLLAFGAALVASAFGVSVYSGAWEAVAFGGFGLGGIIAALITNPAKNIGAEARRLVQIQVAYLGFLSEVQLFSDLARGPAGCEIMEKLGLESAKVIKVLQEI
jgi:hypothetical protein